MNEIADARKGGGAGGNEVVGGVKRECQRGAHHVMNVGNCRVPRVYLLREFKPWRT